MTKLSRRALLAATVCWAADDQSWRTRVTDEKEKGERLIIRGRVLASKGGPPASGVTIAVYQTDAAGIYSDKPGRPIDNARLRGQFKSGPKGEYEIVTIKPGPYPGGGAPMHIHVNIVEPGKEPREIFEFFFAGDPLLTGKEKGIVLQPRKDAQGVWVAVQDFDLTGH